MKTYTQKDFLPPVGRRAVWVVGYYLPRFVFSVGGVLSVAAFLILVEKLQTNSMTVIGVWLAVAGGLFVWSKRSLGLEIDKTRLKVWTRSAWKIYPQRFEVNVQDIEEVWMVTGTAYRHLIGLWDVRISTKYMAMRGEAVVISELGKDAAARLVKLLES